MLAAERGSIEHTKCTLQDALTCFGDFDQCELRRLCLYSNCIVRCDFVSVPTRSGAIHRRQFGAAKSVVKLMGLGNAWRPAKGCVRAQGRTSMCQLKIPRTCVRSDTPWVEAEPPKLLRLYRPTLLGVQTPTRSSEAEWQISSLVGRFTTFAPQTRHISRSGAVFVYILRYLRGPQPLTPQTGHSSRPGADFVQILRAFRPSPLTPVFAGSAT